MHGQGSPATRTSDSHPITVSWVAYEMPEHKSGGRLGLCYCPGKKTRRPGEAHERDLQKDLARLKGHFQCSTLVCLLNNAELRSFELRDYAAGVAQAGLQLIQYPIVEMAAPDHLEEAAQVVEEICARLQAGQVLIMHCRGGVGRAGLMAACVLLRLGQASSAQEAIALVRARRCQGAVESRKQEDFVAAYQAHWQAAAATQAGQPSEVAGTVQAATTPTE